MQEAGFLEVLVTQIRKDHPTMSCRAMYHKLKPAHLGRDKFEKFCKDLGYSSKREKNMRRTTDSSGVIRFDNLLEQVVLTDINQAYASDITYFDINDRFYYLTFIMDCYSRRILGYSVAERLTTEQTTLPALIQAIHTRRKSLPPGVIFHSDGGGQFYDKEFLKITAQYRFANSMCEFAYQNGKAERLNGIIKNNYLKHMDCSTKSKLMKNLDRSVYLYNEQKPHKSLKYSTPIEFENKLHLQANTKHPVPVNGLRVK